MVAVDAELLGARSRFGCLLRARQRRGMGQQREGHRGRDAKCMHSALVWHMTHNGPVPSRCVALTHCPPQGHVSTLCIGYKSLAIQHIFALAIGVRIAKIESELMEYHF